MKKLDVVKLVEMEIANLKLGTFQALYFLKLNMTFSGPDETSTTLTRWDANPPHNSTPEQDEILYELDEKLLVNITKSIEALLEKHEEEWTRVIDDSAFLHIWRNRFNDTIQITFGDSSIAIIQQDSGQY